MALGMVLSATEDMQVVRGIIVLDAIDMVNMLSVSKVPAKFLLSGVSVDRSVSGSALEFFPLAQFCPPLDSTAADAMLFSDSLGCFGCAGEFVFDLSHNLFG